MEDLDSAISNLIYEDIGVLKDLGFLWPDYNKKLIAYSIVYFTTLFYYFASFIISFFFLLDDSHEMFLNINYFLLLALAILLPLFMRLSRQHQVKAFQITLEGISRYKVPVPSSVTRATRKRVEKEINVFAIVLLASMASCGMILFSSTIDSFSADVRNGTSDFIAYNLPIRTWVPFKLHQSSWGTIGLLLGETMMVLFVGMTILAYQLLFVKFSQRIFYEQEILIWSLENILQRLRSSELDIDHCITENIKHHQRIKTVTALFNKVVSPMLMSAWCLGSSTIVFSLYEAVQGKESYGKILVSASLTIAEVLNVFVLSRMGQHIVDLSEEIGVAVRFLEWYKFPASTKRKHLIFLLGTQQPDVLKAGGLIRINYDSFATAMNTSYSYFNFLKAKK